MITLTIIGIIAAITIPNLMQSWRKHERITQIKEAYSIIQNATKMAVAEHGTPDGWDFNEASGYVPTYFLPYVKIQKNCGRRDTGCFIENDGTSTWHQLNGVIPDKTGSGYGSWYYYKVILQNGMHVGIWAPARVNQNNQSHVVFLIDVDGKQGATTLGKDIFTFRYNLDTGKFTAGGFPNNYKQDDCTLTARGASCAYWIERNHWEFPDNYPVKKF